MTNKISVSTATRVSLFANNLILTIDAMKSNTIGPSYAIFVLQALDQLGLSEAEYFAGTSLTRESLCSGININVDDFIQLLNTAWNTPNGERLGLLIGRRSNAYVQGVVSHAAISAPTIRDGLNIMESFSRLHASYVSIQLQSHMNGMNISIDFTHPLRGTERFHIETALFHIQSYIEAMTGKSLDDAIYCLPFSRPSYAEEYSAYLHSPIQYQCASASVELPTHLLDRESPFYDAQVWRQSQYHLTQRIQQLADEDQAPYSRHLLALLNSREPPLPGLKQIAQLLHMSDRTLNRRLKDEGTSFRDLKSQVTQHWANQYLLHSDLSVESVSALLGYEDAANFRRAFKKRCGDSPSAYRQIQRSKSHD